jgi:long-chain acyl-CoA synthetase
VSRNIRGKIRPGTIGLVCDGLEHKISLPNKNGEGELFIKTPNMTKSYYKKRTETGEAFQDEWFKTGDICRLEDDYLIFEKQKKNTGKIKGNMVDLEEVKRAMLTFSKIEEVSINCNDNVLSAFVKVNSITNFDKEVLQIKKRLEAQIAVFKIPQVIKRLN